MGSNSNSIMKKIIYLISIIIGFISTYSIVLSAPLYRFERTLLPEASVSYDIGSGSLLWNNGYFNNLTVSGTCTGCGIGSGGGLGWASTTIPDSNSIYSTALNNVGIGTSTPNSRLSVYESSNFRSFLVDILNGGTFLKDENGGGWALNYGFRGSSGTNVGGFGANGANDTLNRFYIGTFSSDEKISILSSGNAGIGTTSPQSRLHVVGSNDLVYGQELTYPLWVSEPSNSLKAVIVGYNSGRDIGEIAAVEKGIAFKNLVLQSTGKLLGVGTTTPWATLSVAGTPGQITASPVFAVSTSTSAFATTTALMVDGAGRVGVATKVPVTALTIGSGVLLQTLNGVGTATTPDILVTNPSKISTIAVGVADGTNNRRAGLFVDDTNSIAGISTTYGGSSFPFIMRDAVGERIRLNTDGNVNVGTSTTAGQSTQFSIRNTGSFANAIQVFTGTSNTTQFSVNGITGSITTVGSLTAVNGIFNSTAAIVPVKANGSSSQTADLFQAQKNSINYMVVDSQGDVGSGTSTPMAKLSATAKTIDENTFALQGLTGQTGNLMSIYPSNSSTTVFSMNPTGGIFANSASTTLYFGGLLSSVTGNGVCITTNNQITNAGAATCIPSAMRFKQNIEDFNGSALDLINKLTVKTFEYKAGVREEHPNETKQRIGMIAEDVKKVDNRLVAYDKEGNILTLNFEEITALQTKAIQEQQKEIDNLKAEIKKLKNNK